MLPKRVFYRTINSVFAKHKAQAKGDKMKTVNILTREDMKSVVKETIRKELSAIYEEQHKQRVRIADLEQIIKSRKGGLRLT
jgi:hypothetical protein